MQQQIGTHELIIEGDVLRLITRGVFTLDDPKRLLELAEKNAEVFGYRLVLHELSAAKRSPHISYLATSEDDARGFLAEQRRYFHTELKLPRNP